MIKLVSLVAYLKYLIEYGFQERLSRFLILILRGGNMHGCCFQRWKVFFHRTGPVRDWLLVLAIVLRTVIGLFVGAHGASPVLNREFMAWKWWRGMIKRYFTGLCLTIFRGIAGLSVFRGIKVSRGSVAISYHLSPGHHYQWISPLLVGLLSWLSPLSVAVVYVSRP